MSKASKILKNLNAKLKSFLQFGNDAQFIHNSTPNHSQNRIENFEIPRRYIVVFSPFYGIIEKLRVHWHWFFVTTSPLSVFATLTYFKGRRGNRLSKAPKIPPFSHYNTQFIIPNFNFWSLLKVFEGILAYDPCAKPINCVSKYGFLYVAWWSVSPHEALNASLTLAGEENRANSKHDRRNTGKSDRM